MGSPYGRADIEALRVHEQQLLAERDAVSTTT